MISHDDLFMRGFVQDEHGGYTAIHDPGEPQTGVPRVSVDRREADLLSFLARGRSVYEIGTGLGMSTMAMERTARHVATVDPDPWVQKNIWPMLQSSTVKIDPEHLQTIPLPDLVFIDGDHDPQALIADLAHARMICPRGLVVVHDTNAPHIRLTCIDTGWDWTFVNTHHGLGISYVGWDE